jgi:hypothetical protein
VKLSSSDDAAVYELRPKCVSGADQFFCFHSVKLSGIGVLGLQQ